MSGDDRGAVGERVGLPIPLGPPPGGFGLIDIPCFPILGDPLFLLGAALVVLGVGYALYRRLGILAPIGVFSAIGPPVLLVYLLLTTCLRPSGDTSLPGARGNTTEFIGNVTFGLLSGGGQGGAMPAVSVFLLGVLGIAFVAAVVLLVQSTDDDITQQEEGETAIDPERMAAIGRAAGRAADRIEDDVEADNAVYRAWREMTTYLDVDNPSSSTPAEFATAAVAAGMNPDDVSELTALFEDVRYGEAEPTEDRERRAVTALRRIEETYAEETE